MWLLNLFDISFLCGSVKLGLFPNNCATEITRYLILRIEFINFYIVPVQEDIFYHFANRIIALFDEILGPQEIFGRHILFKLVVIQLTNCFFIFISQGVCRTNQILNFSVVPSSNRLLLFARLCSDRLGTWRGLILLTCHRVTFYELFNVFVINFRNFGKSIHSIICLVSWSRWMRLYLLRFQLADSLEVCR